MPSQQVLAAGLSWFDLLFQDRPNRIACAIVSGSAGTAIVDPGPTSCLDTLEASLARHGQSLASVTHLLLTHIHLDHAGATGTILRRHPGIQVVVHERGAPHLVDPAKLLDSATRLYGSAMDRLWGEVAPVPPEQIQARLRIAPHERNAQFSRNASKTGARSTFESLWRHAEFAINSTSAQNVATRSTQQKT